MNYTPIDESLIIPPGGPVVCVADLLQRCRPGTVLKIAWVDFERALVDDHRERVEFIVLRRNTLTKYRHADGSYMIGVPCDAELIRPNVLDGDPIHKHYPVYQHHFQVPGYFMKVAYSEEINGKSFSYDSAHPEQMFQRQFQTK